jgi:hypothetical protein
VFTFRAGKFCWGEPSLVGLEARPRELADETTSGGAVALEGARVLDAAGAERRALRDPAFLASRGGGLWARSDCAHGSMVSA